MPQKEYFVASSQQLGQLVQNRRKALGMTQQQLAERVGLGQAKISSFESEPGHSRIERIFRLLSTLGLEFVIREKVPTATPESEW